MPPQTKPNARHVTRSASAEKAPSSNPRSATSSLTLNAYIYASPLVQDRLAYNQTFPVDERRTQMAKVLEDLNKAFEGKSVGN